MYEVFRWRGTPIHDIEKWARERSERMVKYECKRTYPCILTGQLVEEVEHGSMPESFWNSLMWPAGWSYKEIDAT